MRFKHSEKMIESKKLTELEVWQIVKEWYTKGMYHEVLQDAVGYDLEEICDENIELLIHIEKQN
jgi:hypothetical protein